MSVKKMLLGILSILLYLLIPAVFGGVGAGVYFGIIKPHIDAGKILKKGAETTAAIIDVDSKITSSTTSSTSFSSTTKTDRYYYLRLSFVNSEGDEIECKTRSIYPSGFIIDNNIERGGTVRIMYMGAKAVVKGFVPQYETWLWAFPVVFGAIAAGFLIFLVIGFAWTANDIIIKKFGAPATGTYLEQKKWINGEESNLNSITCSYKNAYGDTVEAKTRFIYSNSETENLAKMGSFPIIYLGKKIVIMIDKNSNTER